MKARIACVCVLCAALLSFSESASAQRQTSGRPSLDAYVTLGFPGHERFGLSGGGLSWRNYGFVGYTSLGFDLSVSESELYIFEDGKVDSQGMEVAPAYEETVYLGTVDVRAAAGYYFRLLSTRDRAFIVSLGANLTAGARVVPDVKEYYDHVSYPVSGFVMGVLPELVVEVFPFRNVSVFVSGKADMTFVNTQGLGDWFRYGFGAGVKIYL